MKGSLKRKLKGEFIKVSTKNQTMVCGVAVESQEMQLLIWQPLSIDRSQQQQAEERAKSSDDAAILNSTFISSLSGQADYAIAVS